MTDKQYWTKIVTKILKAELAKRDLDHRALIEKLHEIGVDISIEDLRGRMSRGTFSAVLFVQCLRAIGVNNLLFEESIFI